MKRQLHRRHNYYVCLKNYAVCRFFYFQSNTFPLFHNQQIIRLRSTYPSEVGPTGETRQHNFVLSRLNRTS